MPSKDRGSRFEARGLTLVPRSSDLVPGARPLLAGITVWVLTVILLHFFPAVSCAGVVVYDAVAVVGREVRLKAETKGTFFRKGGELVEFFVDGKSLGKTLSGGDGEAYKSFTPAKTGLLEVSVKSGSDEDAGVLLVLKKGAGIVLVEIIGGLAEKSTPPAGRPGSREAMKKLQARFPVVYVQSVNLDIAATRKWLDDNEYPEAPVLPWDSGALFKPITAMGLSIRAVVGNPEFIESATKWKPEAFSFEQMKGTVRLRHWKEMEEKLK
jgi:hypothetical protein